MQKLFKQDVRFKDENGNAFSNGTIERVDYFLERYSQPVEVELNKSYRQIGIRSHGKGIFHRQISRDMNLVVKDFFGYTLMPLL